MGLERCAASSLGTTRRMALRDCRALISVGGFFSIENPAGSYLFGYCEIAQLSSLCTCYLVKFAQCAFGLKFPDSKPNEFCRKNTYVLSNMKELRELSRKCPGISRRHKHAHAWGSVKVKGKVRNRASLAGAYPPELCRCWAPCVRDCHISLEHNRGTGSPPPCVAGSPRVNEPDAGEAPDTATQCR